MGTACLFCSIARGDTPATQVYADQKSVAFLDHRPVFKGHVLLIPRAHLETFTDLPSDELPYFMQVAQKLTAAVETGLGAQGSFVAMNNRVSQSVPHVHLHIVPRTKGDGLRGFFWPRTKYASDEEMQEYAARIRAALPEESVS
jgi:histidine triad (HIT) family protein